MGYSREMTPVAQPYLATQLRHFRDARGLRHLQGAQCPPQVEETRLFLVGG